MANQIARNLRKRMTPHEARMWLRLRALCPQGLHFRRQVPIEAFIVDFACLRAKLVIEIDGAQHGMPGHFLLDAARNRTLNQAGYQVLRLWNFEVEQSVESVIDTIFSAATGRVALNEAAPDIAPSSHAQAGEGGAR